MAPRRAPWNSGRAEDPAVQVSLQESLSMALLVVLDRLPPAQRVVFVLHEVYQ